MTRYVTVHVPFGFWDMPVSVFTIVGLTGARLFVNVHANAAPKGAVKVALLPVTVVVSGSPLAKHCAPTKV